MTYIDLTHTITNNMPVFPGDILVLLQPTQIYEKDGVANHSLCASMHIGTHIDAPGHFTEIDKKISDFPVSTFIGDGICIDVRTHKIIDKASFVRYTIKMNQIVFFYTGWDRRFYENDYFSAHPVLTEETAHYLVKSQIKMVGVDFPSVDKAPYAVHKILLSNDILIIENLTNLEHLLNKNFEVIALPLKIEAHGAPARVVAKI